jgi:hypothetical protein
VLKSVGEENGTSGITSRWLDTGGLSSCCKCAAWVSSVGPEGSWFGWAGGRGLWGTCMRRRFQGE